MAPPPHLDGALGEGDLEVVVGSHVVVVEIHKPLDGLFHCAHLKQRHLVVPEGNSSEDSLPLRVLEGSI